MLEILLLQGRYQDQVLVDCVYLEGLALTMSCVALISGANSVGPESITLARQSWYAYTTSIHSAHSQLTETAHQEDVTHLVDALHTVHLQAAAIDREAVQHRGELARRIPHLGAEAVDGIHLIAIVGLQHAAHGLDGLLVRVQHACLGTAQCKME